MPQMPSRQSMMGTSFVPVASTFVSAAFLGFASSMSVQNFVRKIFFAAVDLQFAVGAERRQPFRADGHLDHAGVKVLDEYAVILVILGLQTECVGLDAEVDVLGDKYGRIFWLRLLDAGGERENTIVPRCCCSGCGCPPLEWPLPFF